MGGGATVEGEGVIALYVLGQGEAEEPVEADVVRTALEGLETGGQMHVSMSLMQVSAALHARMQIQAAVRLDSREHACVQVDVRSP